MEREKIMKAVLWHGRTNFDFSYEDIEVAKLKRNQITVKVEATGICGSDLHLGNFEATPPLVPGHEAAGTVVEVGSDVTAWQPGDRVAVDPVQRCGTCYCCTHDIEHLCMNIRHLGSQITQGSWAEYMPIDAVNAHRIPDNVSFVDACLVEPTAVCYQSFCRAGFKSGQDLAIIGDGPFAFIHAQIARSLGARNVIIGGHYDERLKRIADKTGATVCNTHRGDMEKVVAERITDKPGVDVVIEATGNGIAPNIGLNMLVPRGTLVVFSYIWEPKVMDMGIIHMKELNLLGACRSLNCYAPSLKLLEDGDVDLGSLIDFRLPLEQYQKGIDSVSYNKKDVFKAVLLPHG